MNSISIKNLVLSKPNKETSQQQDKIILKGINAEFRQGELNAVMGPNGCGKTTFLSILFGKIDKFTKTSGEILYNGKERDIEEWHQNVSFVEQDGFIYKDQTVLSLIQFALETKKVSSGLKISEEKLQEIFTALHLNHILTKNINEISGGERKRAMIAIELAMMKKVVILDEPTSDLDSHLALQLVAFLKKKAQEDSINIIITIHQPSDQVFKRFDNVLFLLDGRVIFSGKTLEFLESQNLIKPEDWTISDFLFEAFYNKANFDEFKEIKQSVDKMIEESVRNSNLAITGADLKHSAQKSIFDFNLNFGHFKILFKRSFKQIFGSKKIYIYYLFLALMAYFSLFSIKNTYLSLSVGKYLISNSNVLPKTFDLEISVEDFLKSTTDDNEERNFFINSIKSTLRTQLSDTLFGFASLGLFFDSNVFSMKDQFINEIYKGFYSSSTLLACTSAIEIIFFAGLFLILLILTISMKLAVFVSVNTWFFTGLMTLLMALINIHFNTALIHPSCSNSLVKTLLYSLKTFGSYTSLYYLLTELFGEFFKKPVRLVLSILILVLFPSHFSFYFLKKKLCADHAAVLENFAGIASNYNISGYTNSLHNFIPSYQKIFTGGEFANAWMYAGLVFSTIFIISSSVLIFSRIFNPRYSIKL